MWIKSYILVCVTFIFLIGCKEDEVRRSYPRVITGSVTNISEQGAVLNGEIASYGTEEISSLGFTWSSSSDPTPSSANVVYLDLDEVIDGSQFQFELRTTLDPNIKYWVRAFAAQEDKRIFGDTISFISEGSFSNPTIEDFTPKIGTDSTEIIISGNGFSHKDSENTVLFGSIQASILESSTAELKVLVPPGITTPESSLKIVVTGNEFEAEEKFIRKAPEISSFTPAKTACGTAVTINGSNFSTIEKGNKVYFGNASAEVISHSSDKIVAIVPEGLTADPIEITVETAGQTGNSNSSFEPASPIIDSFSPISGTDNDEITILGSNFGSSSAGISVYFGELEANIVSVSANEIIAEVPPNISTKEVDLIIEVGCSAPFVAPTKFQRLAPIITDFNPKSADCTDVITITGSNFGTVQGSNKVFFDGFEGTILSYSSNEIQVMPLSIPEGTYNLRVGTAGQEDISISAINITSSLLCDESLIAYYPFNGNANDESSNSNHGTVSGASLTTDRNGNPNSAYSFDGINDYISLGSDFDYEEVTLLFWFKAENISSDGVVMFSSDHSTKTNGLFSIVVDEVEGIDYVKYIRNELSGESNIVEISEDEWHFATLVIDGLDFSYYLDGNLIDSKTSAGNISSANGTTSATLGCTRLIDRFFTGYLDDVRVYNRVLTTSEITELYTSKE